MLALVYAVIMCLSLRLSVRLSVTNRCIPSRLNLGSRKQRLTIAQRLCCYDVKNLDGIPKESPPTGAPIRVGVSWKRQFSQKRCKILTKLLWNANRNSYVLYRMCVSVVPLIPCGCENGFNAKLRCVHLLLHCPPLRHAPFLSTPAMSTPAISHSGHVTFLLPLHKRSPIPTHLPKLVV